VPPAAATDETQYDAAEETQGKHSVFFRVLLWLERAARVASVFFLWLEGTARVASVFLLWPA
jgi:hypothetical protein